MRIILILLSLTFLYSNTAHKEVNWSEHDVRNRSSSLRFTFGGSTPTHVYDSYSNQGFTFKLAFERPVVNRTNLRFNFGWQNIFFGENVVSYDSWDALQIREGEAANLFDVGIKYTMGQGLYGNGYFKPYINVSVGVGFFRQYMEYDYPDTYYNPCDDNFFILLLQLIFDDEPCEGVLNDNINTVVNDRMSSPFTTVDLGTNISFSKQSSFAIEFGIRYNMINNIKQTEYNYEEDEEGLPDIFETISNKLSADYNTIYFGISWYLPSKNKSNRDGYGKQI